MRMTILYHAKSKSCSASRDRKSGSTAIVYDQNGKGRRRSAGDYLTSGEAMATIKKKKMKVPRSSQIKDENCFARNLVAIEGEQHAQALLGA